MRHLLFVIFLCGVAPFVCNAANERTANAGSDTLHNNRFHNALTTVTDICDSVIALKNSHITPRSVDTSFMEFHYPKLAAKFYFRQLGTGYHERGEGIKGSHLDKDISSPMEFGIGAGLSYRGLSVSLGFNPTRLFRDNNDFSFRASSNGNRIGFEFSYNIQKNLSVKMINPKIEGKSSDAQKKKDLLVCGYYVFNAKQFSYASAITQRWKQRRSAGSFIAEASYLRNDIAINDIISPDSSHYDIASATTCHNIVTCIGYGYNLVFGRQRWMLHFSALPGVVVYNEYRSDVQISLSKEDAEKSDGSALFSDTFFARSPFPNIYTTGRFALVHYFANGHISLTATVRSLHLRDVNMSSVSDTKWQTLLTFGFNL